MTRAQRRFNADKAKARARLKLTRFSLTTPTPRQIGRSAAMHNTCPCWVCTSKSDAPDRFKGGHPAVEGE